MVLNLEVGRAWWQDVKPLGGRRVVDELYLHCVGLPQLEASEPQDGWTSAEKAIAAHCVELVVLEQVVNLVGPGLG